MNAKPWKIGLLTALSLLASLRVEARGTGPFTIALLSPSKESAASSEVTLAPGMSERPVKVSLTDGRTGDPAVIGEISDHDDKIFPARVSSDVIAWAGEIFRKEAAAAGLRVAPDAPLSLAGKLTQFRLVASTKALGSTYNAQVQVAFTLADSRGRTLWEGTIDGDATRYGKERSEENANEVLVDAVREACDNAFNDSGLQSAWVGKGGPVAKSAPAPSEGAVSPSAMLADLVKLKKQGFTTDLLVDYVDKKTLTRALSADDLVKWKDAGMPEEVIKAALARAKG